MVKITRRIKSLIRRIRRFYLHRRYSRKKAKGKPVTIVLPNDISFRLHPWGQIVEVLYTGDFENTELKLTSSFLKEGMNVIDAGANIGLYSVLAAKLVGKNGRVWAFEPSSETYEHLVKNLSLNAVDSVIPNKLALSDIADGRILLKRSPGRGDAERYLSVYPDHPSICQGDLADSGDSEIVEVTNLDSYIGKHLDGTRIDFIKIDVEGCEYAVLQGAQETLLANPDMLVLLECSWQGCQWAGKRMDDIFSFLRSMGFKLSCWNNNRRKWESGTEFLLTGGNLWACRDQKRLPFLI